MGYGENSQNYSVQFLSEDKGSLKDKEILLSN